MVSKEEFWPVWTALCTRFRVDVEETQATMYYGFLSRVMSPEEFKNAARAVWATREFFPRPADFLLVRAGEEWLAIMRAASETLDVRGHVWQNLSPQARDAADALGGLSAMMALDPVRARSAFLSSYEMAVAAMAHAVPLAAPLEEREETRPMLARGDTSGASGTVIELSPREGGGLARIGSDGQLERIEDEDADPPTGYQDRASHDDGTEAQREE